jgi:hypothetical protein
MAPRLTRVQWLICAIASLGFAFDIYELLMLPLIIAPALRDLVNPAPEDRGGRFPGSSPSQSTSTACPMLPRVFDPRQFILSVTFNR